jgi:hypothetical protein
MVNYVWSNPTGDETRPVRGFVLHDGSTTADLPTQLTAKPVVDVMIASGPVNMLAGTGSIATDAATGTNYQLESDGLWHQ